VGVPAMHPAHIDDFYYVTGEVLAALYAAFPVHHILLVEDITGPIRWDLTGIADRKSRACFESLIWLSEHDLLTFRSVEPRDIGIEGAVLTQKAFVLLTGMVVWEDGAAMSRIDALRDARVRRAYEDAATIIRDLLRANCQWGLRIEAPVLKKAASLQIAEEDGEGGAIS
jgi:hypothetical protein